MIANSLSRLLGLLRKQIRLARQVKVSHRLIVLVLLFIPLLFLVCFNLADGMELSQAITLQPWWQSFRTGIARGFWEIVLVLPVSALLWCLVVLLGVAFRKLLRDLPRGQIVRKALLRREKAITFLSVFLLLVVLAPTVILLLQDVPMPASKFVAKYVWELFVSVMLVLLIGGVWKLLVGAESLDDMLVALDHGQVSEAKVNEVEQSQSLKKWVQKGDIIGWYELWEEVRYGGGLRPRVRLIVEQELRRVRQERHKARVRPIWNGGEYEKRLQSLLPSLEISSPNGALLAWDRGEVNRSEVEEVLQMHALEKWIQGDVVGLYELCEMARFAGGLYPIVRSTVKAELPHVQQIYAAGSRSARCVEQLQLSLSDGR